MQGFDWICVCRFQCLQTNRNKGNQKKRPRSFHLIISEVVHAMPQLSSIKTGLSQVFIQHNFASLTLNENADHTVSQDFEMFFNKLISERDSDYLHDEEGDDDMPAHLKASLLRASVMIPMRHEELTPGNEDILFMNVILATASVMTKYKKQHWKCR